MAGVTQVLCRAWTVGVIMKKGGPTGRLVGWYEAGESLLKDIPSDIHGAA